MIMSREVPNEPGDYVLGDPPDFESRESHVDTLVKELCLKCLNLVFPYLVDGYAEEPKDYY